MDGASREFESFSYGAPPRLEQGVIPQHSTLVAEGASPLDLTSAIVHELQRANHQLGWHAWASGHEHAVLPGYGAYLPPQNAVVLPHSIPQFDDAAFLAEFESQQEFYSRIPQQVHQVLESSVRSASSPWIERVMQADVAATPAPSVGISTSLSLAQRGGSASDPASPAALDFASCHSSERPQRSDPLHESTVEVSADLCTDEDDADPRPVDEKRRKRMLSNRASAQRSRQRRQERLDELEVLTAKLRVENSTLQKKLSAALEAAKKFEDQSKALLKRVQKLESGRPKEPVDECWNSQQTTCASSSEMVGGGISVGVNGMRDGTDGASTLSMSAVSPGWPSENGREVEVSTMCRSFPAIRLGKKRSFREDEEATAAAASQPSRPRLPSAPVAAEASSFLEPRAYGTSFGLDPASRDTMDCLDTDRWLEFAECFK